MISSDVTVTPDILQNVICVVHRASCNDHAGSRSAPPPSPHLFELRLLDDDAGVRRRTVHEDRRREADGQLLEAWHLPPLLLWCRRCAPAAPRISFDLVSKWRIAPTELTCMPVTLRAKPWRRFVCCFSVVRDNCGTV